MNGVIVKISEKIGPLISELAPPILKVFFSFFLFIFLLFLLLFLLFIFIYFWLFFLAFFFLVLKFFFSPLFLFLFERWNWQFWNHIEMYLRNVLWLLDLWLLRLVFFSPFSLSFFFSLSLSLFLFFSFSFSFSLLFILIPFSHRRKFCSISRTFYKIYSFSSFFY